MTKIIEPIDCAGTRGARQEAVKSHKSMLPKKALPPRLCGMHRAAIEAELMTVYCALNNETPVECEVEHLGCGAGRIKCLECGGDGNWGKFAPEIVGADCPCVDCKGTGWQMVSV